MSTQKPYLIRVRAKDAKPREPNQLKGKLFPYADVHDAGSKIEFILCVAVERQLDQIRAKLESAGLEEVPGGPIEPPAGRTQTASRDASRTRHDQPPRHSPARQGAKSNRAQGQIQPETADLAKKPYGFVPLPDTFQSKAPIWHDGSGSAERLSGGVRLELTTLTPMLVGWERRRLDEEPGDPWRVPSIPVSDSLEHQQWLETAARQVYPDHASPDRQLKVIENRRRYQDAHRNKTVEIGLWATGPLVMSKALLYPLRAPWGERPVLIPGDTLKGLLRHELGALLGTPMERTAERSYSYRPNSLFSENARLVARIARIPAEGVEERALHPDKNDSVYARVPTRLTLLPLNLRYDRSRTASPPWYRFDPRPAGSPYRGGQGAGDKLNSKRALHRSLGVNPSTPEELATVPTEVIESYLHTLRHLTDPEHGHFSERHPDIPEAISGDRARARILEAARTVVFQPGDLVWVEWDTENQCVVSFGWHYYYRWAYQDTVRRRSRGAKPREGLFPTGAELQCLKDGRPEQLTAVRRLFGYTGDNDGSRGIGSGRYSQLMGRVSVNTAVESVADGRTESERFLPPTFLRELGMPRPSAVEYYLKQPNWPNPRPSDKATLITYGDAADYDISGELAGRKFYLDRKDAYTGSPWSDASPANRLNERSTLALEASRPCSRFRFTVRFRDLETRELASILLALCPNQFGRAMKGTHDEGYCSKLGYARPLGWGSVRIEAKELQFLRDGGDDPPVLSMVNPSAWFQDHQQEIAAPALTRWLSVHRHRHPDAANYPHENGQIFTFHTGLRARHSRARRYMRSRRGR